MKRFVLLLAVLAVALFLSAPAHAAGRFHGRFGGRGFGAGLGLGVAADVLGGLGLAPQQSVVAVDPTTGLPVVVQQPFVGAFGSPFLGGSFGGSFGGRAFRGRFRR